MFVIFKEIIHSVQILNVISIRDSKNTVVYRLKEKPGIQL